MNPPATTSTSPAAPASLTGRFDVHSHLLPGVDDGCDSYEESIRCARAMVAAGYTHSFCTPHVWPRYPHNNADEVPRRVAELQRRYDAAGVSLKLYPGGELNLYPQFLKSDVARTPSYNMLGKYALIDLWAVTLPSNFEPAMRALQAAGRTVILAHPERMDAVQDDPGLADYFADLGLLLQGNLQCLGDPVGTPTRDVAEKYLSEGRYFLLGSDLHNLASLDVRLRGLKRAIEAVGDEAVNRLTVEHPRLLVGKNADSPQ